MMTELLAMPEEVCRALRGDRAADSGVMLYPPNSWGDDDYRTIMLNWIHDMTDRTLSAYLKDYEEAWNCVAEGRRVKGRVPTKYCPTSRQRMWLSIHPSEARELLREMLIERARRVRERMAR